jgi:hypothetical protein
MKCPDCNQEMAEGYIPLGYPIHWRDKDQAAGSTHPEHGGLPLGSKWDVFRRRKLQAFQCPDCQIVSFHYGDRAVHV